MCTTEKIVMSPVHMCLENVFFDIDHVKLM